MYFGFEKKLREVPPLIVAELANAAEGDGETVLRMIDACVDAGVDAIKVQFFLADELLTTTTTIWRTESRNGGQTWTEPVATALDAPDSEALLSRIPSTGDLLLWNDVASERGTPRTPLTTAISRDEGDTWDLVGNIDDRENFHVALPSAYFMDDEVIITYIGTTSAGRATPRCL